MEEEEDSGGGGGGWLVSFADLMTLLFAAFVVLYGITPSGESDQVLGVMASVRESFLEVPDDIIDGSAKNILLQGKLSFTSAIRESSHNPAIKKFNRESNVLKTKQLYLDPVDLDNNEASKGKNIHRNLRQASQVARWELGPQFRRIEIVFFKPGTMNLNLAAKNVLRMIGDELRHTKVQIYLEGHTQEVKVNRLYSNLELAVQRTGVVKKFMIQELGIPESRLLTAAYGSLKPSIGLAGADRMDLDNRVEIKVKQD